MVPRAGIWYGSFISNTTSGWPMVQRSAANLGEAGRSLSLPFGAPASTHAGIGSICLSLRRGGFLKTPCAGSAPHGGTVRVATRLRIDRAHGRASSYLISDIGANIAGRWHSTHLEYKI